MTLPQDRRKILNSPLEHLTRKQKWVLKLFLVFFGHLITTDNDDVLASVQDPVIFCFNHNSSFETLLVCSYLMYARTGRPASFLIDWMYGYLPLIGSLTRVIDPIYVYNKPAKIPWLNRYRKRNHNAFQECVNRLNTGVSIAIFPEGTRNRNPHALRRARKGIGSIVLETDVPVFPIGIDFPGRRRGSDIPKLGTVILRMGNSLHFTEEARLHRINGDSGLQPGRRKRVQAFLQAKITHAIMMELASLSGKTYPFRPPTPPEDIQALSATKGGYHV
jgi:1-acyl-sn-glycerol-3-phosphate acyltransferase